MWPLRPTRPLRALPLSLTKNMKQIANSSYLCRSLCLLLLLIAGAATEAMAQLRLEVSAPSNVDMADKYFQVKYTIKANVEGNITLPAVNGLRRLAGPARSFFSESVSINGKTTANVATTFTYTFAAEAPGTYTLPAAKVTVGGKTYTSDKAQVKVTNSGKAADAKSAGSEELREAGSKVGNEELVITANLAKETVYEQEALPLTYVVYEKPGVGLNNISLNQQPDFKGMVSQELDLKDIQWDVERRNGQLMRKAVVKRYLLFPQQSGEVTVPRMTFNCVVLQRDASLNPLDVFFNSGGSLAVSVSRTTNPCKIKVKPLPSPRPDGFSGAVGQMEARAYLVTPQVRTNETATLRISVSGKGNLQLLTAPKIELPSHCDAYTPKTTSHTTVTAEGMDGSVTFDYTFVPRQMGDAVIKIPPFISFDPASGQYRTDSIATIRMHIEEGERSQEEVAKERALLESDIRPLYQGKMVLRDAKSAYFFWNTWGYYLAIALIIVATIGIFILTRFLNAHREQLNQPRGGKALRQAIRAIQRAGKDSAGKDKAECYGQLAAALTTFAVTKARTTAAETTKAQWPGVLQAHGIDAAEQERFLQLLDKCEWVKFAPVTADGSMEDDAKMAIDLLKKMDKAWK